MARSLPTTGKSREHTESKTLQEAQQNPAEGVRAQLLQFSKSNILDLSLEDITDVHICRWFVRIFNSILSLADEFYQFWIGGGLSSVLM